MSSITLLTDIGRQLMASFASGGQPYASVKIAVGDGNGQVYTPNVAQTALVRETWRGVATVALGDGVVIFQATIPANVGGFTIRECAVLIGSLGAEQIFIVSQHPTHEQIAAPANGAGPHTVQIPFAVSASQTGAFPLMLSEAATLGLSRVPHITVDQIVTAPPSTPADGLMVAIDVGASGAFAGKAGWLAERVAGAWLYKPAVERLLIRVVNGMWYENISSDWVPFTFAGATSWASIADKPSTFPPAGHNHAISDVTSLQGALDGKVAKAGDTMTGVLRAPRFGTGRTPQFEIDAYVAGSGSATIWAANDTVSAVMQVSGTAQANLGTITNHPLVFLANNTERLRITASQFRMQGQADLNSPSDEALRVWGSPSPYAYIHSTSGTRTYMRASASDAQFGTFDAVPLLLTVAGSEVARFSTAGNFGVGVSPSYRLDVSGPSTPVKINSSNSSYQVALSFSGSNQALLGGYNSELWVATGAGAATFRVGASGQLGLGASSNFGTTNQVLVSGGPSATAAWANINDLINIPALFPAGRIIAHGVYDPSNLVGGTAGTQGSWAGSVFTFTTPRAAATYTVRGYANLGVDGSGGEPAVGRFTITKTVNGFTVTGAIGPVTFFVIE